MARANNSPMSKQQQSAKAVPSKDLPPSSSPYFPSIFFKGQFCSTPVYPPPDTDLTGRTAIVTGANTGLGLECARQLLSFQLSRLVIAVRSPAKGEDAAAPLRGQYPRADIQVWPLDMASYPSIQEFVRRVDAKLDRVDYVVLNAGVWKGFDIVPSTGHEEIFQVNYLSQALLTFLLLPVLKHKNKATTVETGSPPTRLTWVNSGLALAAKFPQRMTAATPAAGPLFPTLSDRKTWDSQEAYCTSKLLAHYFLWELAEHVPVAASSVVVTLADPGYVRGTALRAEKNEDAVKQNALLGAVVGGATKLFGRLGKPLDVGASSLVDAVVNHGAESHGCYIWSWHIAPFASMVYGDEGKKVREQIWRETLDEFEFADVEDILNGLKQD